MDMGTMVEGKRQIITGVVAPQFGEAIIRETWPSVAATPAVAKLGAALQKTIVLAPLGWLLLAPFYFKKVLPFIGERYTLTNRRVMIRRLYPLKALREIALADIDDVRLARDSINTFFRSATLEIISKGNVALQLRGVKEADSFRLAIINSVKAWVPGRANNPPPPASAM